MSRYSHQNIRAPKGEASGSGRNYQGRFQKSYLDTMNDRLAQKEADVVYLQQKFDEAKREKNGKNIGLYATMLDRARKDAGHLEMVVAREEAQQNAD